MPCAPIWSATCRSARSSPAASIRASSSALMTQVSGARVKTFSIGFEQPEYDELAYARRSPQHFDTDHHEDVVRPDGVGILDTLVSHFDEPFGDTSAIPTWYVSQLARAARHRRAVRRRRRRAVRRLRPVSFQDPRVTAIDRYAPAALRRVAGARRRDACRKARAASAFCATSRRDARGRYLDAIGFFTADDKAGLLSDGSARRGSRPAIPSAA